MVALWNRADHYIFCPVVCFLLSFFPRLISVVTDWMSAILPHMVSPYCEFRMQVWNVLHAAGWKCRTQKIAICTIIQLCRAISSQWRHVSTIGKNLLSSNISSICRTLFLHDSIKFEQNHRNASAAPNDVVVQSLPHLMRFQFLFESVQWSTNCCQPSNVN